MLPMVIVETNQKWESLKFYLTFYKSQNVLDTESFFYFKKDKIAAQTCEKVSNGVNTLKERICQK